jgi:hypothetical protein
MVEDWHDRIKVGWPISVLTSPFAVNWMESFSSNAKGSKREGFLEVALFTGRH